MKGLFMKDYLIMKNQSKTILMIFMIGVVMSLTFEPTALIYYITMIGSMVAISTIAYDEIDNGYAFIFSLPIRRKSYVIEKYLFIFGVSLLFMLVSTAVCLAMSFLGVYDLQSVLEELPAVIVALPMLIAFICSVTIPLRIKYGSEKSRIFLYVLMAACGLLAYGLNYLFPAAGVKFVATLEHTPLAAIIVAAIIFTLAITFVSEKLCEKIIMAKQF